MMLFNLYEFLKRLRAFFIHMQNEGESNRVAMEVDKKKKTNEKLD